MKRKYVIIFLFTLLTSSLLFLSGCNRQEIPDNENTLEISLFKAGYGVDFLYALADEFERLNPGKEIYIKETSNTDIVFTELPSGPAINKTDLYLSGNSYFDIANDGAKIYNGVKYDNALADLTDLYNSKVYGEDILFKDKMYKEYEEYYNQDGKYYMVPWAGGITGLTYNKVMFDKYGWDVPLTTTHMFEVCDDILDTKVLSENPNSKGQEIAISPFIHCMSDTYWSYVYYQWWAQYDGIENYNNFFKGIDSTGAVSYEVVNSDGQYEALSVLQRVLSVYDGSSKEPVKRTNVYTDPYLSVKEFTDVQMNYLLAEKNRIAINGATTAAMMPTGDWLENEMYKNFSEEIENGSLDIRFMKVPIISSIINKTPSIKDEETLREVIKYIDGATPLLPAGVSTADYNLIKDARNITCTLGSNHNMVIPAYSNAIELAKDFIRFMASDKAIEIYMSKSKGNFSAFYFDLTNSAVTGKFSNFQNSKYEIMKDATYVFNKVDNSLFYRGGLKAFNNDPTTGSVESRLAATNPGDFLNADEIIYLNYVYVKNKWNTILADSNYN